MPILELTCVFTLSNLSQNLKSNLFYYCLKQQENNQTLMVHGIEQVLKYTYFGAMVNSNDDYTNEIKVRTEKKNRN